MKDYYSILGLNKNASQEEISKAYKELALKYHPDRNPDNLEEATAKFKEVQEAFDTLSDPSKKLGYDNIPFQFKTRNADDIFRAFSHIFEKATSNGSKIRVKLTLEEAYKGCIKLVNVYETNTNQAKEMLVNIPPGIAEDTQIRIPNADSEGKDLFISANILKDDNLKREGKHLFGEVFVPYSTLVLGGTATYQLFDLKIEIKIRPKTKTGSKVRLRGQGMPSLHNPNDRGDLFVFINLKIPEEISEEHKQLLEKLSNFDK